MARRHLQSIDDDATIKHQRFLLMDRHPTPARAYMEVNLLKMKVELLKKQLALKKLKYQKFIEFREKQEQGSTKNY